MALTIAYTSALKTLYYIPYFVWAINITCYGLKLFHSITLGSGSQAFEWPFPGFS